MYIYVNFACLIINRKQKHILNSNFINIFGFLPDYYIYVYVYIYIYIYIYIYMYIYIYIYIYILLVFNLEMIEVIYSYKYTREHRKLLDIKFTFSFTSSFDSHALFKII